MKKIIITSFFFLCIVSVKAQANKADLLQKF